MKHDAIAMYADRADRRWTLAAVGLAVAVTAAMLYATLHRIERPAAPAFPSQVDGAQAGETPHAGAQQIEAMVARLAARLEKEPDNAPGWQMLARSYAALGRFADAAQAYGRAAALLPASADPLADQADALVMARSGDFAGEPTRLIRRALALDPNHGKALALAGTAAFKRGDYAVALADWRKALASLPPDDELAASLRASVADAEARSKTAGRQAGG